MYWILFSLTIIFAAMVTLTILPVYAKTWTVEQRQTKLMQDVNAGQKSGALTVKQSRKLRKNLANVARKKAKMKLKNEGKVSIEDNAKLQSRIDEASSKIKTEQLKKN